MKYEIRQIDAWNSPEGWTWNESFHIGEFHSNAKTNKAWKRTFTKALQHMGITFKLNRTLIDCQDGEILEIQDRKTKEPLFAAIPME